LRWLYLLTALPIITNLLETGAPPFSLRSWLTEVTAALVIAALVYKVRKSQLALLALAVTDPLTGLRNRRTFMEAVEEDCARSRRLRAPLSLVCIDLDNFKLINDRAGHAHGDRVLQQLAAAIHATVRVHIDRGFRLGGDEFALLLPGTSAAQAEYVLARIHDRCAEADRIWTGGPLRISSGIVEYRTQESAESFVRRSDEAMYRMKRSGKSKLAFVTATT
jgi:diguanylate cyclase (GGDEF)-like protein